MFSKIQKLFTTSALSVVMLIGSFTGVAHANNSPVNNADNNIDNTDVFVLNRNNNARFNDEVETATNRMFMLDSAATYTLSVELLPVYQNISGIGSQIPPTTLVLDKLNIDLTNIHVCEHISSIAESNFSNYVQRTVVPGITSRHRFDNLAEGIYLLWGVSTNATTGAPNFNYRTIEHLLISLPCFSPTDNHLINELHVVPKWRPGSSPDGITVLPPLPTVPTPSPSPSIPIVPPVTPTPTPTPSPSIPGVTVPAPTPVPTPPPGDGSNVITIPPSPQPTHPPTDDSGNHLTLPHPDTDMDLDQTGVNLRMLLMVVILFTAGLLLVINPSKQSKKKLAE